MENNVDDTKHIHSGNRHNLTNLDSFIVLYRSIGIELKPVKTQSGNFIIKLACTKKSLIDEDGETHSEKFDGYYGFYSDLEFDSEGSFIRQGFWE